VIWLILGLLLAVLGAAPTVYWLVGRLLEWRGAFTGYWVEVTYGRDDDEMAGDVAFVDLLRVRHHASAVRGAMWRVCGGDRSRSWKWHGACDGHGILGTYEEHGGRGGKGVILMSRAAGGRLHGKFLEDMPTDNARTELESRPMDWIRVRDLNGTTFSQWVDSAQRTEHLPFRARHALSGRWTIGRKNSGASIERSQEFRRADFIADI